MQFLPLRAALTLVAALLAAPLAAPPALGQEDSNSTKPTRIVSLNLCVDQLLLTLADPENVASVTWLALDPAISVVADRAANVPYINRGTAEEILPLEPDLVIAGAYTTKFTIQMLQRFGYKVEVLGVPTNLNEVREQILQMGQLLHESDRASEVVAEMDEALAEIEPATDIKLRAAVFQPGGFTIGPGSFEHELLIAAGLHNVAEEAGIAYYGFMSLEQLLLLDADLLVSPGFDAARPSISEAMLDHPSMRRANRYTRSVTVPQSFWACAGPMNTTAVKLLAGARTNS